MVHDDDKQALIRKVARVVNQLPPMPGNVERILRSGHDDRDMLLLIRKDPGLCADVLHLANTSGDRTCRFDSIDSALEYLGEQPVRRMVCLSFAQKTVRSHFIALRHLAQYFVHSQAISHACRALARAAGLDRHEQELYATAGLIHDIGRLVILLASNRLNAPLIGTTLEKIASIDHDERRILGLSHAEVGWQLCRKWDFSPVLQEAVRRHHTPLEGDRVSLPGAFVFLAHFVVYQDPADVRMIRRLPSELLGPMHLTAADVLDARNALSGRSV